MITQSFKESIELSNTVSSIIAYCVKKEKEKDGKSLH
jgi:hypothetical protein